MLSANKKMVVVLVLVSLLSGAAGGVAITLAVGSGSGGSPTRFLGSRDGSSLPGNPGRASDSPVVAIAEQVGPAVVGVTKLVGGDLLRGPRAASGSGVIIDGQNGYIVTNYHVIEGADEVRVSVDENRSYKAKVVGSDPQSDVAVLKIDVSGLPAATWGDSDQVRVGEMAVAIGNPLGREFARSVTVGVISAVNRDITVRVGPVEVVTLRVLQTDAAINPGNSGGALVNERGEVIGINSVKIAREDVEGMGFAIPSNDVRSIVDQLLSKGYVSRPFLGIYDYVEVTPELSNYHGLPRGIFVGGVVPGGPAEKAGIRAGDVITYFGGSEIKSEQDLVREMRRRQVGERVEVKVFRQGQTLSLQVTLGEAPRRREQ